MAAEQQLPAGKAGSGRRFAVTCGLLRQYMKEQGGLAPAVVAAVVVDPASAAEPEPEERKAAAVLELFPQQAGTLIKDSSSQPQHRCGAPLTIFYGGRMVVFDDFPAEKADELMQLAGSRDAAVAAAGQPCLPDMPIARKASLRRFLEKRKGRVAAADPYPAAASKPAAAAVKEEAGGAAPWLGVNSVLSLS